MNHTISFNFVSYASKRLYIRFFFFIKIFNFNTFYKLECDEPCTHSFLRHKMYGGAKASRGLEAEDMLETHTFLSDVHYI